MKIATYWTMAGLPAMQLLTYWGEIRICFTRSRKILLFDWRPWIKLPKDKSAKLWQDSLWR